MTFQFHIQILGIDSPKVWRRVLVQASFSFHKFHQVIQDLFGWYDMHLYEFSPEGLGSYPIITHPGTMCEEVYTNSARFKLEKYYSAGNEKLIYTYDFGDCWKHKIKLEKIFSQSLISPVCLGGEGACPPEDCGGVAGFEDFKLSVNDPAHEEYESIREWVGLSEGEIWDVNEVNKDIIIRSLEKYK